MKTKLCTASREQSDSEKIHLKIYQKIHQKVEENIFTSNLESLNSTCDAKWMIS